MENRQRQFLDLRGEAGIRVRRQESPHGFDKRVREIHRAITMGGNALALDIIELCPEAGGIDAVVTQQRERLVDDTFVIDVVFPKGVIGIDEQIA